MMMGEDQQRRLMELLGKLAARDAGAPTPSVAEMISSGIDFNGPEHNDAKTLVVSHACNGRMILTVHSQFRSQFPKPCLSATVISGMTDY